MEVLKYRSVTEEYSARLFRLFSSLNYANAVKHLLQCLIHLADLNLGKISLSEFNQLTTFRFSDFIESRTHVRYNLYR